MKIVIDIPDGIYADICKNTISNEEFYYTRQDNIREIIKRGTPLPEQMDIKALEQTRWIPCSERLPEVSDYYLIQYSRRICPDEMAVAFYSVEEAECDSNYTWEFKPFADCKEVIAWMPLPQPYKESEEE